MEQWEGKGAALGADLGAGSSLGAKRILRKDTGIFQRNKKCFGDRKSPAFHGIRRYGGRRGTGTFGAGAQARCDLNADRNALEGAANLRPDKSSPDKPSLAELTPTRGGRRRRIVRAGRALRLPRATFAVRVRTRKQAGQPPLAPQETPCSNPRYRSPFTPPCHPTRSILTTSFRPHGAQTSSVRRRSASCCWASRPPPWRRAERSSATSAS